jgi:hypothetical protein
VKVAQLVRSEETRSRGSRESSAGNAGRLEMCLHGDDGKEGMLDEATVVIVSTVLVIGRRRLIGGGQCRWRWLVRVFREAHGSSFFLVSFLFFPYFRFQIDFLSTYRFMSLECGHVISS